MSESRVYKVPETLHGNVEAEYMDFMRRNPVLSMGADERRRLLKEHLRNPQISAAVEHAKAPPPWAEDLGFDPDDELVLRSLRQCPEAFDFLKLVRGWPRSQKEREVFARKAKYSNFVTQRLMMSFGHEGSHNPKFSEGTFDWNPATASSIARKAFL